MNFKVIALIFVASAFLMLRATYMDEISLAASASAFVLSGTGVAIMLIARLHIYSGVLIIFHVGMTAFTTWVFLNSDKIVDEVMFVFSVFSERNLQTAIVVLVSASLASVIPSMLITRSRTNIISAGPKALVQAILGPVDQLPRRYFQFSLCTSFVLALWFFLTNTSVMEVSYPFQTQTHWVPWEIKKVPTLLAVFALGFAYAHRVNDERRFAGWLAIARLNFLVVSILMLLITGSRGMFTFFWGGIGILELLFWSKRRGSLGWAALFLALFWFTFTSWPYMRWFLSILPLGQVLSDAFQIGLGLNIDNQLLSFGEQGIRLSEFPMIGTSLFHLLYTIQLIHDGNSLGGSTFVNLLPQSLPSWLDGIFWVRPLNDNWLLAEQYYHEGGFLIDANAYWNGGLGVVVAFMFILSTLFTAFDKYLVRPQTGLLYRFAYMLWFPVMIVQVGYGIQGIARVVELLVAMMLLDRYLYHRGVMRDIANRHRRQSQTFGKQVRSSALSFDTKLSQ